MANKEVDVHLQSDHTFFLVRHAPHVGVWSVRIRFPLCATVHVWTTGGRGRPILPSSLFCWKLPI
jgi:hypothetical protein